MVSKHFVEGYDEFCKFIEKFDDKGQPIHIYFGGSKLPSGESWCDDCVRAAPVIEEALEKAKYEGHFIYVQVGDRPFWKDMNCPFRKDKKTKLMVLPTVLRWQQPQRLEGDQCEKLDLLEMLLSGEE
ncbi:thioredoxin domain-containing protein 17-like [Zophobas morio]|uniref:thioredoxin domain-containing protein 17-like n=1 Tax=Zophobas morio TaxID=2755281 RepID=UPI003083C321